MDAQRLAPLEAWDDFYTNFKCEGNTPNEIILAEYTRREKLTIKGRTKTLGEKRIKRLLEKYAPGKYRFHEAHFTKEIGGFSGEWKRGNDVFKVAPDGYVNDVLDIVAKSLGFEDEEA